SGGTPSRKNPEYFLGNIPWVKSGELKDGLINATDESITEEALANSSAKLFPAGTVLMAMYGATIGKTATLGIDASSNQAICAFFPDPSLCIPQYLRYQLIYNRENLVLQGHGGAQPNISQTIIRNQRIWLAPKNEQKKIAAVLSTIQQAVELQDSLVDITQELKKALMQKLFTEGLRSEAQKKTEIGLVPASWVEKRVDDVAIIKGGKRLPKGEKFRHYVAAAQRRKMAWFITKKPIKVILN
ncbi:MAG TPA: restriction endonuclease subunit S, partial [Stenomitos sp.]